MALQVPHEEEEEEEAYYRSMVPSFSNG